MHLADVDWLPILRRTLGIAAVVMALGVVSVWIANFAIGQVAQIAGADNTLILLMTLGWIEIVAGGVVLLALAAGLWFHKPLWAPGVLAVVLGMALHWGWWFLDRKVDLFGTAGFNDPDPELVRRAAVRMWVMFGIDALAVGLLLLGAVLLFRRTGRSGQADAASDRGGERAGDDHDDVGSLELQGDGTRGEGKEAGVQGDAGTPATQRVQDRKGRE